MHSYQLDNKNLPATVGHGEPFQIVWSDLSFRVDLSAYDKLINGLLRAKQSLGFNRRIKRVFARGTCSGGEPAAPVLSSIQPAPPTLQGFKDQEAGVVAQVATTLGAASKPASSNKRTIFENLNGCVKSGEITAILGPSGAGKTSLLNALCGRTENYGGRIRLLGGGHANGGMRLSIIPQKDYLIENLSVRENLLYSSKILNPDPDFDHDANILRVVKMLNLSACFNSIASKISGGEYKRVTIAQELLRQPDILILDEPTSGLDSLNCKNLIRSLASLIEASRCGRLKPIAILLTIHQPDVDIFHMFHHVYCMARAGRVIYDGPPADAMQTLRSQAGRLIGRESAPGAPDPLDSTTNPANLLIEIASEEVYGQEPIECLAKFNRKQFETRQLEAMAELSTSANDFGLRSDSSEQLFQRPGKQQQQPSIGKLGLVKAGGVAAPMEPARPNWSSAASTVSSSSNSVTGANKLVRDKRLNMRNDHKGLFWYHTRLLTSRAFVSTIRDPLMTMICFLFHLSIPFVMWTVYSKRIGQVQACPVIQREMDFVSMASNRTAERLEDLQDQLTTAFECSTMFFLTTYSFSMCGLGVAALAFPLSMHILLKEVRNGWYNLPAYVLAKTFASFAFEVLFPVMSLVLIYIMLGMPASLYHWRLAGMALVMALVSMISNTQGLIFGALAMDSVQTAIFLSSASSLPQTLLSGFTARIKFMPALLQKLSWLSQYRYSSDLINMIRFGFDTCPCDQATDQYLRDQRPDFKDVPAHLKPIFIFYLAANSPSGNTEQIGTNSTTTSTSETSNATTIASTFATTMATVGSNLTEAARAVVNETQLQLTGQQIKGVEYELMLKANERAELLRRMETGELDLFARMADLTGRSFTYGRPIESCETVRSQLLITAGTPADHMLPTMFAYMFALLLACKLILFFVVRHKIGSRV